MAVSNGRVLHIIVADSSSFSILKKKITKVSDSSFTILASQPETIIIEPLWDINTPFSIFTSLFDYIFVNDANFVYVSKQLSTFAMLLYSKKLDHCLFSLKQDKAKNICKHLLWFYGDELICMYRFFNKKEKLTIKSTHWVFDVLYYMCFGSNGTIVSCSNKNCTIKNKTLLQHKLSLDLLHKVFCNKLTT